MFVQVLSLALLAMAHAVPLFSDYGHAAPVSYSVAAPIKQIVSQPVYSQPIYQKAIAAPAYTQVVHSAPVIQKSIAYQAPQIVHAAPQIVHAAPQIVHAAPQVVHAAPQYVQAPVYQKQIIPQVVTKVVEPEPIDPNPKYSFAYGVSDPHTGDSKNAEEHLEDGVIHGSYSLVEPDGHVRKVTYTADHVNGFNAVVERTGGAKVVAAAPVAKYISAPVTKVIQAAPAYSLGGHPW